MWTNEIQDEDGWWGVSTHVAAQYHLSLLHWISLASLFLAKVSSCNGRLNSKFLLSFSWLCPNLQSSQYPLRFSAFLCANSAFLRSLNLATFSSCFGRLHSKFFLSFSWSCPYLQSSVNPSARRKRFLCASHSWLFARLAHVDLTCRLVGISHF